MEIEIFVFCDYARNYGGQLSVIGVFNQMVGEKFPWLLRKPFHLVGRLAYKEGGKKHFKLSVFDPDGKPVGPPSEWDADVKNPEEGLSHFEFGMVFESFMFEKPGKYLFKLESEGDERILALFVYQRKNA